VPPLPTRHFDILLVEDNEADVGLTTAAFRDALVDARVHVVEDGEEATAFLARAGRDAEAPRPDLVILDLSLPKGDGFEVLEAMKADPKLKTIPVIVMSGSDRPDHQSRAYKLQAAAYIVKPADKDKYFAAIRSIKELWFHNVTPAPKEFDTTA
jgi:chemotaxis family two-component system response regulator Rcp1